MKSYLMMGLCILLVIVFAAISVHALEIRSSVAGTANGASNLFDNSYTWNSQNFVGFNYDIDHDVGSEILTTTLTEGNKLSGDAPYGIVYESSNRIKSLINAQVGMKYGKLSVRTIDTTTGTITLDNKDNAITLSKNKNTEIMPGIYIKTADNDKLRYYIYKNITNPGKYEIRSSVAGTVNGVSNLENGSYSWNRGSYTWNPQNFAGFYYDIKEDLGTENLKAVLADGSILSGDAPYGITYCTVAQSKSFKYGGWGIYSVIGFMGKEFFAGYFDSSDDTISVLYARSTDKNSLSSEQLEQILMDERTNLLIKKGESIKLKDGYELVLKGLNNEGQIYLELLKGGNKVDETYIAPSKILATEVDKTYCYRKDVGRQKNLVTIAVHFSSSYKDEERTLAAVDGIWQISDAPAEVKVDKKYDKMNIRSVDGTNGVIVMDNEGTTINLTRKTDVTLMPGINLRTAYNDTLRFYLYKTETVGSNTT